ncbi:MAG: hypothetical protein ACTSRG_04135 [Candidatus Helarchaeota archaeon]
MFEDKNKGIVFIIILFVLGGLAALVAGIIAIVSPSTVVGIANGLGLASILNALPFVDKVVGIGLFNQPLLSNLPLLGVLAIIVAIVVLIDVWGLWTEQGWAWILTVLISLVMIPVIIGIIYLWILFKEDVKMTFGQV